MTQQPNILDQPARRQGRELRKDSTDTQIGNERNPVERDLKEVIGPVAEERQAEQRARDKGKDDERETEIQRLPARQGIDVRRRGDALRWARGGDRLDSRHGINATPMGQSGNRGGDDLAIVP